MELVVVGSAVWDSQGQDIVPPQGLQDDRVDVRKSILVAEVWQTMGPNYCLEFGLSFLRHLWVKGQCQKRALKGPERLWEPISGHKRKQASEAPTVSAPAFIIGTNKRDVVMEVLKALTQEGDRANVLNDLLFFLVSDPGRIDLVYELSDDGLGYILSFLHYTSKCDV